MRNGNRSAAEETRVFVAAKGTHAFVEAEETHAVCSSGGYAHVCNVVGERGGGSSHSVYLKELGGGVEFIIETVFCHLIKKHSRTICCMWMGGVLK